MEISGEYYALATLPPAKYLSTQSIRVAGLVTRLQSVCNDQAAYSLCVVTRLQSVCYEVRIVAEAVDFSLL